LSAGDGSGAHVAEQALWRAAKIAPVAPWYVAADPKQPFIAQARAKGAYALVERGAWAALGGAPLAVVVEGDPQLVESVHAMRSFRVSHPAGKIFLGWIAGGRGRAAVAAHGGMRPR
jgi:tungstate transport system substrate-binding protein